MRSVRVFVALSVVLLGAVGGTANSAPMRESAALDVNSCGLDEFTGTSLDTARWNQVLRPNASGLTVADGQLKLQALTGDEYGNRDTAQNVVLQDLPSGAWTATTQLDSKAFTREGQQAGFIVRKDDKTFSKFVVINKGTQGRWFEHIFTNDQQPRLEIGTDTTAPLNDSFPALVYIRVVSDGNTIRGEYSGDGSSWTPIGRPAQIGAAGQIGVYAADNSQDGPEVPFEFVALNAQSDEFAGSTLEKCRWSTIVREDATAYRVQNGALELDTTAGEVGDTAKNLIGQPVPAGAWEAETKIDLTTTAEGQQAGTLLYKDEDNFYKTVLVDKGATSQIESVRVKDGAYQLDAPFKVDVPKTLTSFYLRMRSNGTSGQAAYSANGTDWTDVGKARDISDVVSGSTLGPLALRGGAADPVTAKFDYFRMRTSPVAACTPAGTVETGFTRLWNGIDLSQTRQAGPGSFTVVDDGAEGCRLESQGGLGLLWFNTKTYDNFVLRTQFKTSKDTDNSGIFVRFPDPGTDPNVAIAQGHEIQIREGVAGDGEDQKTGSVYNFKRETARAAKPAGQWNDYEIRYEAGKYTITLNGTTVNEWTNDLKQAKSAGYIGLQNHSTNDTVSFRNLRIQELAAAQTNLFTTIGITRSDTRANSQIYGNPTPYSLPAEEMPPSGTVGAAPVDTADDVKLRMPDTSGTKPNLAAFRGQTLTLRDVDQKAYTKLHFFGTTSDGGPAGGDFILKYADGTTATIAQVRFPDWCGQGNASAHFAIGPLTQRYRTTGSDGARCGIYHFPADNPQPTKTLVSVTLPSTTTPGNSPIQAYLMALTLEDANGLYTLPDLSGQVAFPDDQAAPTTTGSVAPATPDGSDGWFKTAPRITLSATDTGGSGVEQMFYKVDDGTPQNYNGPFDFTQEGEHTLFFQSIDAAGNAETFKSITLKVDPNAPETTTRVTPGEPLGDGGWYDSAVKREAQRRRRCRLGRHGHGVPDGRRRGLDDLRRHGDPGRGGRCAHARVPLDGHRGQRGGDQDARAEGRRHRADDERAGQRRRAHHGLSGPGPDRAHAHRRRRLRGGDDRVPRRRRRVDHLRHGGRVRRVQRRRAPRRLPLDRSRRQHRELQDAALQRRRAGGRGRLAARTGDHRPGAQAEALRLDRGALEPQQDRHAAADRPDDRADRLPGRRPRDDEHEGLTGPPPGA